jgi:hypothetical protein
MQIAKMIFICPAKYQGVVHKQKMRNIDGTTTPKSHTENPDTRPPFTMAEIIFLNASITITNKNGDSGSPVSSHGSH